MKVEVRFSQDDDLAWCKSMDHIVDDEEIIKEYIDQGKIVVATMEGQRVGYFRLEYLWLTIPYIGLIFLPEKYRGQGIGRAILEFVESFLRAKGHKMLMSSSQVNEPEPQAWHREMGFQECGILAGINEGGIGEVFFRKELK